MILIALRARIGQWRPTRTARFRWATWGRCLGILVAALLALTVAAVSGHTTRDGPTLSKMGPAPDFVLSDHQNRPVALRNLRGRVVAVTFLYTGCTDTCPVLAAKLVAIQSRLSREAAARVFFVAITVDPEKDTPQVLRQYARTHGADLASWAFLTGPADEIRSVARRYGVYIRRMPRGDVDHTFLTSVIDQAGTLRVQYLGVRFDSDEFLADLQSLLSEAPR